LYVIDEPADAAAAALPVQAASAPLFEDVSDRIGHTHHENTYDDFRYDPLLPLMLSRLGPGVAWLDVDRDGDEDLLIASGKGGALALFENRGNGRFASRALPLLTQAAPGDQTAIVGWAEDGRTKLVVGSANYEQGNPNVPSAYVYTIDRSGHVEVEPLP